MNIVRNTPRLGLIVLSVLAGTHFTQSVCMAQKPSEGRPAGLAARNSQKADLLASRLKAENFSVAKAVKIAEDHCKGMALAANGRCLSNQPNAEAVIDVTVMDADRNVQLVTVGTDGRVHSMRNWTDDMHWGSSHGPRPIVKADQVIGRSVVNARGETLGKIEDLAIDPTSGRVGYAVLSFEGVPGVDDKLFAMPWPRLQPHTGDTYVLDVGTEQLQRAPGFTNTTWPDMNDIKWNESIHAYYQQPYYWNEDDDSKPNSAAARRPFMYRGSDVIGMNVINKQKESIGEIEDLAVDPQSGKIRYAVISVGGFLGMNERYVAVPWSAFNYDSTAKKIVLDVDKKRIQDAPGFDKKNWPQFGDETWATTVHKHYRVNPYWMEESRRGGTITTDSDTR